MHASIVSLVAVGALVLLSAATNAQTVSSAVASAKASHDGKAAVSSEDTAIRPFHVKVPQVALDDLRRRLAATRWPDRETVTDQSQGVPLDKLQALVRYWGKDYDWRRMEARLNALPQFVATIDGVDIHFIHVRSALDIQARCRLSSRTGGPD